MAETSLLYAGIGSRDTPLYIQIIMRRTALGLGRAGWTLRSGGARGADSAFIEGAQAGKHPIEVFTKGANYEAMTIAAKNHPAWERCDPYARDLLGRNVHILLGPKLVEPVRFVLCWTDSLSRSGTAHACRVAHAFNIPVVNLWHEGKGVKDG